LIYLNFLVVLLLLLLLLLLITFMQGVNNYGPETKPRVYGT